MAMKWERMKLLLLLIALTFPKAVSVNGGNITLMVWRQKAITQLTLNTVKNVVASSHTVVSGVDESFSVLISFDVNKSIVAYMESSGNIRLVSLNANESLPSYIHRSSGIVEETVTTLAMDYVTGKLYVGIETGNAGRVEVCPLDGLVSCTTVLYSSYDSPEARVDALHSLVLDPVDGYMYWLNRVHKRIERAWMDGRHHDPHCFKVDTSEIVATAALTLDQSSRSLYYVRTRSSPEDSHIWSCSLYDRESCHAVASRVSAFYLDVSSEFLLWTSVTYQNSGITVCEKRQCDISMHEIANSAGVEALTVFEHSAQPKRQAPNPCAVNNGGCSHVCVLIPGAPWRSCLCPVGVRLLQDRLTCSPNGVERALFVATTSGLIYISLDTVEHTPMPVTFPGSETHDTKIMHVDYDPLEKKVYVIDGDAGVIRKFNFNGTEKKVVVSDLAGWKAEALAVDWLNRNLYWLDASDVQIKMQRIDGNSRQIVVSHGLKQPRGLALDPDGGYLYFADWHESTSRIERTWLDGSHRRVLIYLEKDAWPNGIAVDTKQKRIYWAEGNRSLIKSASLEGNLDVRIFSSSISHPYSLSLLGDALFCNSLYGRKLSMFRIPQRNETSFGERLSMISDTVIYGQMGLRAVSLNHFLDGSSPCQTNNGGCSQICVKLPNGERRCVCSVGYELRADNTTCLLPAAFLIYTQSSIIPGSNSIMRISLEKFPSNKQRINIADMDSTPSAIQIDQRRQRIYWTSEGRSKNVKTFVRSALFNGSGMQTLFEGPSVSCIALDWITNNIYWCNSEERRIIMARGDGRSRRTIAWENIDPRHIVIHPVQQFVFFVNQHLHHEATINKMPLGGDRQGGLVVVNHLNSVCAIAIDYESKLLVWAEIDDKTGGIYVADFNGGKRKGLVQRKHLAPTALAVYQRQLYVANAKTSSIDLFDGNVLTVLHSGISRITNLEVAYGQSIPGLNVCAQDNGGCNGLCLPEGEYNRNASAKCICEDHFFQVDNGKDCLPPKHFIVIASRGRFLRFNLKVLVNGDIAWKDDPYLVLPVTSVGTPVSISFDSFSPNRWIYWIDSHDDKIIKRASDLSNSVTELLSLSGRSNCAILFHLAVDELGRQLFVSCAEHRLSHASSIHVWRIRNIDHLEYIGVIVSGRERSSVTDRPAYPRQIALFPRLNLLFYIDVGGSSPVIVRCSLDGRHCIQWEAQNLSQNAKLHACQTNDRLYYTTVNGLWSRDAHIYSDVRYHVKASLFEMDMAPISEHNMLIIAKNESQSNDLLLELLDDMPSVTLEELKSASVQVLSVRHVLALTVVGNAESDAYDSLERTCATSHCSHMCRVPRDSRKRHECLCPLGYGLQTPNGSSCFEHVSCLYWQFKCDDGQSCIHHMAKCDGYRNCVDGSDESPKLCRNMASNTWPCDDQRSIARPLVCNGIEDCKDGSDEAHCRCADPLHQFDCTVGSEAMSYPTECINRELVCNGVNDCYRGADEEKELCTSVNILVTQMPTLSPAFEFMMPLAVVFFACCVIVIVCCCHFSMSRPFATITQSAAGVYPTSRSFPLNAEARVLLPAHPDGTQVELQLRTFSIGASSSLYNALPPPNSQISCEDTYQYSVIGTHSGESCVLAPTQKLTFQEFQAPPPSAASLSTYGVVKPAGMRLQKGHQCGNSGVRRTRRRTRHRNRASAETTAHSPPPAYSQITTTCPVCIDGDPASSEDEKQPQMPVNSRIMSTVCSTSRKRRVVAAVVSTRASSYRLPPSRHLYSSSSSSDISLE